jgi:uncharacterized protein (TIGR00369 family)
VAPRQPPAAEFVRTFVATSPFARRTGLQVVDLTADRAELRLPFDEGNVTVADVVHGGAIATLLDVAVTAAAFCAPEALDAGSGATISLTVNYVRAGRGDLVAVGRAVRRAGGLCFCSAEATDGDGRTVATAIGTYRYA